MIISYASPFEQSNAALGIYPPERCEAIKSYIAAQTNNEADAVQFVAPPVPEGM